MIKKWFHFILVVGVITTCSIYALNLAIQWQLKKSVNPKWVAVEPIDENAKDLMNVEKYQNSVSASQTSNKITPSTKIIEKIYEGNRLVENVQPVPEDWVNKTKEQLQQVLHYNGDWIIESFSSQKVIISKKIKNQQYYYILLQTEDNQMACFNLSANGDVGTLQEVFEDISIDLLSKEQQQQLKDHKLRFKTKEEVYEFIENFHG